MLGRRYDLSFSFRFASRHRIEQEPLVPSSLVTERNLVATADWLRIDHLSCTETQFLLLIIEILFFPFRQCAAPCFPHRFRPLLVAVCNYTFPVGVMLTEYTEQLSSAYAHTHTHTPVFRSVRLKPQGCFLTVCSHLVQLSAEIRPKPLFSLRLLK